MKPTSWTFKFDEKNTLIYYIKLNRRNIFIYLYYTYITENKLMEVIHLIIFNGFCFHLFIPWWAVTVKWDAGPGESGSGCSFVVCHVSHVAQIWKQMVFKRQYLGRDWGKKIFLGFTVIGLGLICLQFGFHNFLFFFYKIYKIIFIIKLNRELIVLWKS